LNHYGKSGLGFDPSFLDLVKKDFLERSDLKDTDSWMGEIYDEFYIRKDLVFDDVVKLIGFVDKGSTENRIDELEKSLSSEVSSTVAEECMFVVMGVSLFVNLEKLMPVAFFSYHHHQVLCTVKHFFGSVLGIRTEGYMEQSYIMRLRCSACQSQIPMDDQCSHLIGLFTQV